MESPMHVSRNDAAYNVHLPEKLREAHRRARDLSGFDAIEVVTQALYELTAEHLLSGGRPQSSMEAFDVLQTGYAVGEVRKLKELANRRRGADIRKKQYEPVKTAAIALFLERLPSSPDWRTKLGRISYAKAAASLSFDIVKAYPQHFTNPDQPKVTGDRKLAQENFEKTLTGWLSKAYAASLN